MNLADFSDELNLHLESDDYDSIGGYMIGLLDHHHTGWYFSAGSDEKQTPD